MKRKPIIFNEQRLQAMMDRKGIDVVIVRGTENSKYISEFFHNGGNLGYRPFTVFYFRDPASKPAFVVPAVDLHLAMESTWIEDVRAYAMAEFFTDVDVHFYKDFFEAARDILTERNVKGLTIGTEGENLTTGFRQQLEEMLAGNKLVDVALDMDIVRMVKTPEEIRRLRKATEITVKAHESFRAAIKPGNTDEDLTRVALARMIAEGADGIHFINVGCGPETSFAAHSPFPTGHMMQAGDFVKVDMGAMYRGYPGDFVRSYFIGQRQQPAPGDLGAAQRGAARARHVAQAGRDRRRMFRARLQPHQQVPAEFSARIRRPRPRPQSARAAAHEPGQQDRARARHRHLHRVSATITRACGTTPRTPSS